MSPSSDPTPAMRSFQQLQEDLVNEITTIRSFYTFLESQVDELELFAQVVPSSSHPLRTPCRESRKLMMIHMGIVLILKVLEEDRIPFVQNGLKRRVYDWVNEEPILRKETVDQTQALLKLLRPIVFPGALQFIGALVESDTSSDEDSSDVSTVSGSLAGDYVPEIAYEETVSDRSTLSDVRGAGESIIGFAPQLASLELQDQDEDEDETDDLIADYPL